jgi:hypothetical protein
VNAITYPQCEGIAEHSANPARTALRWAEVASNSESTFEKSSANFDPGNASELFNEIDPNRSSRGGIVVVAEIRGLIGSSALALRRDSAFARYLWNKCGKAARVVVHDPPQDLVVRARALQFGTKTVSVLA